MWVLTWWLFSIHIACALLYIDSCYHVCLYIFVYVCIYLFCMIVYYMTTIFLHDYCLCLIAMISYDIDTLMILIDSLAMIILLVLICIFTLLYILFVSIHWFSLLHIILIIFHHVIYSCCILILLGMFLVWLACRYGWYICSSYDCLLHDFSPSMWCMYCLFVWDTHLSFYLQLPSLDRPCFPWSRISWDLLLCLLSDYVSDLD